MKWNVLEKRKIVKHLTPNLDVLHQGRILCSFGEKESKKSGNTKTVIVCPLWFSRHCFRIIKERARHIVGQVKLPNHVKSKSELFSRTLNNCMFWNTWTNGIEM